GQQVALFGGPLFSILKALTAIRLAQQATRAGVETVPVFWLATEDHDFVEVNHVDLLGTDHGSLERISLPEIGAQRQQVGSRKFGTEIVTAVEHAARLLGDSPILAEIRNAYRPGESLGSAMGKLFAQLFAEQGLILLDPSDADLHRIAEPIFSAAV